MRFKIDYDNFCVRLGITIFSFVIGLEFKIDPVNLRFNFAQ